MKQLPSNKPLVLKYPAEMSRPVFFTVITALFPQNLGNEHMATGLKIFISFQKGQLQGLLQLSYNCPYLSCQQDL